MAGSFKVKIGARTYKRCLICEKKLQKLFALFFPCLVNGAMYSTQSLHTIHACFAVSISKWPIKVDFVSWLDDWAPLPLATLTEESELALRDESFQKLLKKAGLVPPASEQV